MPKQRAEDAAEQQGLNEADTERPKNRPLKSGFYKGVAWAVFSKVIKRDDDTEVTVYNTVIEGRYQDRNGEYQSTNVFTENQLVAVEDAAREARQHIREQLEGRRANK